MEISFNYIAGASVDIRDKDDPYSLKEYTVEFIDDNSGVVIFQTKIKSNHWAKTSRAWYTKWRIKVYDEDNELIKENLLNLRNKIVRINLESRALGDTIGCMPYVEEFRKIHGCHVQCATFHNNLFEDVYNDIHFLKPGVNSVCDASYNVTIFESDRNDDGKNMGNLNPNDPYKIPVQRIITDILGLEYKELKSKVNVTYREKVRYIKEKYVCISEFSTAKAKLWNNPNGWQELVDYLNSVGYKVVAISKEPTKLKNVIDETGDFPIEYRINNLLHCEFFIGVSSGLAWLAWALGKKVVMISGFTKPFNEFKCVRIHNENVCNGCIHDHLFNIYDYEWCPIHKGTENEFICTKSITSEMVIEKIKYEILENKMLEVPVSNGEIVDKVTILQIKLENIKDEKKLENIRKEYETLFPLMKEDIFNEDHELYGKLLEINKKLWDIEDKIRDKERENSFDEEFIELARSVYYTNDERSIIKKEINKLTGSGLVEEKSYKDYKK
jgi:autotransporter strand-loop-strand O-heptosyltransferase